VNQNAPTGICCIKKFSGVYIIGLPHKRDKYRKGIQEKQQGRTKGSEGKNRERRGNYRNGGEPGRGRD
jgi:hypothetical protein